MVPAGLEKQKGQLEVTKELLIIKRDQLAAELDQFKKDSEHELARLQSERLELSKKVKELETGTSSGRVYSFAFQPFGLPSHTCYPVVNYFHFRSY